VRHDDAWSRLHLAARWVEPRMQKGALGVDDDILTHQLGPLREQWFRLPVSSANVRGECAEAASDRAPG